MGSIASLQTVETDLSNDEIKNKIIHALSWHGFVVTTQTPNSLTLAKETKPNCFMGFILLCVCVIPAIIYAIIGGSKTPLVASIKESSGSNKIVTITGNNYWVYVARKSLGSSIEIQKIATPAERAKANEFCSHCGAKSESDSRFCGECGNKVV